MATYKCDNCDHIANEEDLPDAKDLPMRLTPGYAYTDKECPECEEHALCFPVGDKFKQPAAPAIDAFSKDDLLAILEAARVALKDERTAVRIADAMDESDRRIAELRDKLEAVMQSDVSLFAPTTKFIVCEVIEQKPAVSLHDTEEEALDHAAQCALENLKDPDDDEDNEVTRASFRDQLTEDDRICEGDYEIYILTPTNRPR